MLIDTKGENGLAVRVLLHNAGVGLRLSKGDSDACNSLFHFSSRFSFFLERLSKRLATLSVILNTTTMLWLYDRFLYIGGFRKWVSS